MIKFGTGGWRAVIGDDFIAENIRRVAAGIVLLAKEQNKASKPIIIGYDRRFLSEAAAKWVAETLAANGIKVWFMNRSAPTPLVMHTVKAEKLHFGIEITASHNPKEYNGYKAYWDDGAQLPPEHADTVSEEINRLDIFKDVKSLDYKSAIESGIITLIGAEIDEKYLAEVQKQAVNLKSLLPTLFISSIILILLILVMK